MENIEKDTYCRGASSKNTQVYIEKRCINSKTWRDFVMAFFDHIDNYIKFAKAAASDINMSTAQLTTHSDIYYYNGPKQDENKPKTYNCTCSFYLSLH